MLCRRSTGSLVSLAMGVASQAAVSAFSTAKDVFHTLQASNQYVPPQSNWSPPPSSKQWTPPPASDWTPSDSDWTPPDNDWTPAGSGDQMTRMESDTEQMTQLLDMGFANRERNLNLLEKHDNNLERVIQELVSNEDADWHANRH